MHGMCRWGFTALMVAGCGSAVASDDLGALFDVSAWTEQSLELPATGSGAFDVTVNIGGVDHTFALEPWSFRAPGAKAYEVGADGVQREFDLAPARTYRGVSVTDPTVEAAGTLLDKGLTLQIIDKADDAAQDAYWSVQPINEAIAGVPRTEHIVYAAADNHAEGLCGGAIDTGLQVGGGQIGTETASNAIEMAFDADFEFYGKNGSNTQQTIDDIDTVMAGVIIVYERDVDATFESTQYIVRTAEPDPYSSTNSSTLLNQFTSHWNSSQQGVHRDLAHLFTGKNIDSSVIGIAWLSAICTSNGYGVSESRFTLSINSRIALTAHEIGHNASAPHCSGSTCHIMCAGLGGCGGIGNPPKFGTSSINTIAPYIASRSCVDPPGPRLIQIPFADNFDDGSLDALDWIDNTGATIVAGGANAVSESNVLQFAPGASLATSGINLDFTSLGFFPQIQMWARPSGGGAGDQLILEYTTNDGSTWNVVSTTTAEGLPTGHLTYSRVQVPVVAMFPGSRLRLRTVGAATWEIDNFEIGAVTLHGLPWGDTVTSTVIDANTWSDSTGITVETATNPPSGTFAFKLDASDTLTSNDLAGFYIDNAGASWLSAYVQHRGAPAGQRLVAEFFSILNTWTELWSVTSDGTIQSSFALHQAEIPFLGWYDGLQVRFRVEGAGTGNDWFIDDVLLGEEVVVDDCAADLTGEGDVNTNDFFLFLSLYQAQDPQADFSPGGGINTNDFFAYLAAYQAGC